MGEYLAIKNWEQYQTLSRSGKWIKDYTEQSAQDKDIMELTLFQRAVLQEMRRLRGRLGKNVPYDQEFILRSMHAPITDRPRIGHAIGTLIARGFLVVTDQELNLANSSEKENKKEKEKEKKPSASAKPRGGNSQTAKATGETRHTRIKQLVEGFYRDWAGAECPWDGSEAANLDRLLRATPGWVDSQFVQCFDNLARSDCVAKGDRPREWLGKLPKFLNGPLDKFKNPKGLANGNNTAKTTDAGRANRNIQALVLSGMGTGVQRNDVPDGPAIQHRTSGGSAGHRGASPIASSEILAGKP